VGLAGEDSRLDAAGRPERARRDADEVRRAPRGTVARGSLDAVRLRRNKDVNLLHDRPDFRTLQAELGAPAAS
jgi:hypothetical protein